MVLPFASLDLRLATTSEGSRRGDVETSSWKCRIGVADRLFDVLVETGGRPFVLGSTRRVRAFLLDWVTASTFIEVGAKLTMFELKSVDEARGVAIADVERASA